MSLNALFNRTMKTENCACEQVWIDLHQDQREDSIILQLRVTPGERYEAPSVV